MRVTDFDIATDQEEIYIEIENRDQQFVKVRDFLSWLVDKKVWFLDSENLLVSIPDSAMIWNETLEAHICTTANVSTYTWKRFNTQYRHKLNCWFQEYVNDHFEEPDLESNDQQEIDAAIEYRRKFA